MIDGFAALFREKMEHELEHRIGDMRVALSSGTCKSLEDYKDKCGYIRALQDVSAIMDEVAQGLREGK